MSKYEFTLDYYRRILSSIKSSKFSPRTFTCLNPGEKTVIIRHDIDHDIASAVQMAAIEQEFGVKTTYLVLLRTPNYNIFQSESIRQIHEIKDMGHDIGLHFSLLDHPEEGRGDELENLIIRDANFLSDCLGLDVKVFGFHNPDKDTDFRINVSGYINSYGAPYFDDAEYISDSGFSWKGLCPSERIDSVASEVVQILIHPHNFASRFSSDVEKISQFVKLKTHELAAYNTNQCRSFGYDDFDLDVFIGNIKFHE